MSDWLDRAGVSPKSSALLRELASSKMPVGSISPHDLDAMRTESELPIWRSPAQHGLVLFGDAPNGDAWALDVANGESVVILSHDLVWEADENELRSPRDALLVVAESLAVALEMARAGTLPIDYWEAQGIEPRDGRRTVLDDRDTRADGG